MAKDKRVTRTIRVYEPTAQLIEAILRKSKGRTFADVVEEWANSLYPESSKTAVDNFERLDEVLDKEFKPEDLDI